MDYRCTGTKGQYLMYCVRKGTTRRRSHRHPHRPPERLRGLCKGLQEQEDVLEEDAYQPRNTRSSNHPGRDNSTILLSGLLLVPEAFFHLGGHRAFNVIGIVSSCLTFNLEILLPFSSFQLRILPASVSPDFVLSGTAGSSAATIRRCDSAPVELPGPFPQIHFLEFCLQRLCFSQSSILIGRPSGPPSSHTATASLFAQ